MLQLVRVVAFRTRVCIFPVSLLLITGVRGVLPLHTGVVLPQRLLLHFLDIGGIEFNIIGSVLGLKLIEMLVDFD
jgi:hypothetical protein